MKNGVLMSPSYHVDEVNKVVVCTLQCDAQLYKHPAYYYIVEEAYRKKFPIIKYGGFEVKAKARCNAIDTFDVKTGMRIAESRAKAKAFRIARKMWQEIAKNMVKQAKKCEYTSIACAKAENTELEHINNLTE